MIPDQFCFTPISLFDVPHLSTHLSTAAFVVQNPRREPAVKSMITNFLHFLPLRTSSKIAFVMSSQLLRILLACCAAPFPPPVLASSFFPGCDVCSPMPLLLGIHFECVILLRISLLPTRLSFTCSSSKAWYRLRLAVRHVCVCVCVCVSVPVCHVSAQRRCYKYQLKINGPEGSSCSKL